MNNNLTITVMVIVVLAIIMFAYFNLQNKNNIAENNNQENIFNSIQNINIIPTNEIENTPKVETEISSFSTPLAGDANRLENIRLSCSTVNGTTLKNGETFSFNDIIGEPTEDKGYKEADVLVETSLTKGVGGGNCQVSSTLYNACLAIPEIEIVERHPHKKPVAYVAEGKDASVSYGILDLKFKNNTGSTITIYMDSENNAVTARIVKS